MTTPPMPMGIEKEEKSNAEAQRTPRSAEKRNPRAHTECLCHERKEGGVKQPLHKQEEVTQEGTIYGAPTIEGGIRRRLGGDEAVDAAAPKGE